MTTVNLSLKLSNAERDALVKVLRIHARYREGDLNFDTAEAAAALSADPAYAYDPDRMQHALSAEHELLDRLKDELLDTGKRFDNLADEVETSGEVDLTDEPTWHAVREALEYAGGWLDDGPEGPLPPPLQRISGAVRVRQVVAHTPVADTGLDSATHRELQAHLSQPRSASLEW